MKWQMISKWYVCFLLLLLSVNVACNTPFIINEEEGSRDIRETERGKVNSEQMEAADSAEINAEDREVRVLVVGHSELTDSYDIGHAFNPTSRIVHHITHETLITFPEDNVHTIQPSLAEKWTISDDQLTYTFFLRDDVTFANGEPMTAEDVVFSFNRLKYLDSNASHLADPIESVEALDDHTVEIVLNSVRPSFLVELINTSFSVTSKQKVEAAGGTDSKKANSADTARDTLDQMSAGTGPYILESWTPKDRTILVRNDNYWGENRQYFDRIIILNIDDASAQQEALLAGEIQLALDVTSKQVAELRESEEIGIFESLDQSTHFLMMNRDPEIGGPVADPRVALAIRYALDYEGYLEMWDGSVTPGSNLWVGTAYAFGPKKAFKRDLAEAQQLMDSAGYEDGFEIVLDYPDFTFGGVDLNVNAEKIKVDLAEIGIQVELNPEEIQKSLADYRNGDQGFAYWGWSASIFDPSDLLNFLPGGLVADQRTNWTEDKINESTRQLIADARNETDILKRQEIFEKLQNYSQVHGPYAPFVVPAQFTVYSTSLEGMNWNPEWGVDLSHLYQSD